MRSLGRKPFCLTSFLPLALARNLIRPCLAFLQMAIAFCRDAPAPSQFVYWAGLPRIRHCDRSKAAGLVPCIPQGEQRIPYGQLFWRKWQVVSVCLAVQGLTHTVPARSERLPVCLLVRPAPAINSLITDNALAGLPARSQGWAFYPLGRPPLPSRKADLLCAIFR